MTEQNEHEVSHPLEEVTGERDVPPEQDDTRRQPAPRTDGPDGPDEPDRSGSEGAASSEGTT
jgi:hypothetical protein